MEERGLEVSALIVIDRSMKYPNLHVAFTPFSR